MVQKSSPLRDAGAGPVASGSGDLETPKFESTRIRNAPPDLFDPNQPRLGRRESEPHSEEVSYLRDVLKANYPKDRVIWDLHHYFAVEGDEIDFQLDISFFVGLEIPYTLSSYRASEHENRAPSVAINILSKSTWRVDIGEHLDYCRVLSIPIYVVFAPFEVASVLYKPPFLRVYKRNPKGDYAIEELRTITLKEGGAMNPQAVIETGETLPFNLGLMERGQLHQGNKPLYRLVLIRKADSQILLTQCEMEKICADTEKTRVDAEKARAETLASELEKLKKKMKV